MNEHNYQGSSNPMWKSIWKRSEDDRVINKISQQSNYIDSQKHICLIADINKYVIGLFYHKQCLCGLGWCGMYGKQQRDSKWYSATSN